MVLGGEGAQETEARKRKQHEGEKKGVIPAIEEKEKDDSKVQRGHLRKWLRVSQL